MSAQYECNMCGEKMAYCLADAVITTHKIGCGTEEYHFCEACTRQYIEPILQKAIEAADDRDEEWMRHFEKRRFPEAAYNQNETNDPP